MLGSNWYLRANLKLRHLQLLVALDELHNVGRVAAYLNVTQPAVSKTLSGLEEALKAALFTRTPRGMEPTQHGAVLIRHARDILAQLAAARDELVELSEGRITRVAMGVLPATAVALVPRFIALLETESSDVAANIVEGTMGTLLPMLRAGEIDLVVGTLPVRPMGIEFGTELLYEDPLAVVVRAGHPLAQRADTDWPNLAGYPMVLPPMSALTRDAIDRFMGEHGVRVPRRHVESLSTMSNVGVLQFTDSVGFLSLALARHFQQQGLLSVLPLKLSGVQIRVGLIWMVDRRLGAALQLVRRLLRASASRVNGAAFQEDRAVAKATGN